MWLVLQWKNKECIQYPNLAFRGGMFTMPLIVLWGAQDSLRWAVTSSDLGKEKNVELPVDPPFLRPEELSLRPARSGASWSLWWTAAPRSCWGKASPGETPPGLELPAWWRLILAGNKRFKWWRQLILLVPYGLVDPLGRPLLDSKFSEKSSSSPLLQI